MVVVVGGGAGMVSVYPCDVEAFSKLSRPHPASYLLLLHIFAFCLLCKI